MIKYKKTVAWNLLVIFTFSNVIPLHLLANSSGPSQPEVETFQPINTSGLVNKFTGDFSYNLPLLSVPGPNGSYPVNLIYSAGPSMYQEASWVGLGWNLNPGSIKRHLNGIPDEFNGDAIRHFNYEKNHKRTTHTIEAEAHANASVEINKKKKDAAVTGVGGQASASTHFTWIEDNYRGNGYSSGYSLGASVFAKVKKVKPSYGRNSSVSLSSFDGITSSYGVSFGLAAIDGTFSGASLSTGIQWSYNSKSGHRGMSFSSSASYPLTYLTAEGKTARDAIRKVENEVKVQNKSATDKQKSTVEENRAILAKNSAVAYASMGSSFTNNDNVTAQVTSFGMARSGNSSTWGLKLGIDVSLIENIVNVGGSIGYTKTNSSSGPVNKNLLLNSYGYLNLGNNHLNNGAMDYAMLNRQPLSLTTPSIAYPRYAQDGFVVYGQGMSGFFQAKRNDFGLLHQKQSYGKVNHNSNELAIIGAANLEDGLLPSVEIQYDGYVNSYTENRIGKWHDDLLDGFDDKFQQTSASDDYYEPYSFFSTGEMTFRDQYDPTDIFYNNEVLTYDMVKQDLDDIESYGDENLFGLTGTIPDFEIKKGRTSRNQYFEPVTFKEYNDIKTAYGSERVSYLYEKNEYPDEIPVQYEDLNEYVANATTQFSHHFKEVQVYNVNGQLYEYGVPAYNNSSRDITFSSKDLGAGVKVRPDIDEDETEGHQKSYKGTEVKNYSHSHLLTAIYSPDYVDITNNGPTEDDFGFWVKFNYSKVNNYFEWGFPAYGKATYLPGNASDTKDQYASFQSGSKKLYYLNSIETKSHIAKFHISNRADASTNSASNTVQKLDHIKLYNKGDDTPLKTVHFKYDYSLCSGIPNFYSTNADPINEPGTGKLTLKKMYTTYRNNLKGRLSSYTFDYDHNPSFVYGNFDSWGVHKAEAASPAYIDQVPFPEQMDNATTKQERDLNASSWSLSKITLPSKGTIEVDYEMDDYLWVQDKKAMQMHEIIGLSETNTLDPSDIEETGKVTNKYRIFFKFHEDDMNDIGDLDEYMDNLVDGIDHLYFRTWMNYKTKYDDYVKGYALVDGNYGYINHLGTKIGYIDIKPAEVYSSKMHKKKTSHGSAISVHPFQAEVLKQLQHYRADLEFIGSWADKKRQLKKELKKGFERMAMEDHWGENFNATNPQYPSFIKLNTANKAKFGGGHRVKSVRITDNAEYLGLEAASYGKTYHYINRNGESSGVTGSEPFASKEESPFKKPMFYSSVFDVNKKDFNDLELYEDYCLAEPFFPSAQVGYSRILEESCSYDINGNKIILDPRVSDGIIEEEYYTSKDFPVSYSTELRPPMSDIKPPKWAPPLYSLYKKHESFALSQGLTVEVNDMNGKLKTVGKYPYHHEFLSDNFGGVHPVYQEKHIYATDAFNKLESNVPLSGDGSETADLGLDIQTAVVVEQNRMYSYFFEQHEAVKFTSILPFVPLPLSVQVTRTHELSNSQLISTSKVISRNGVLKSKETYIDGKTTVESNRAFSEVTGSVAEVAILDEHEELRTLESTMACEIYPQAQGKYLYDNLKLPSSVIDHNTTTGLDFIDVTINGSEEGYLKQGDKLLITVASGDKYIVYIDGVTPASSTPPNSWSGTLDLIEQSGLSLEDEVCTEIKVINPANTNQLTLPGYNKTTRNNKVVSAMAVTYKDDWLNEGFEEKEVENYTLSTFPELKYENGQKGVLRSDNAYSFKGDREYSVDNSDKGAFVGFTDYDYSLGATNQFWISPILSSKYSPYGYSLETENLRGIKSSSFYDYDKSLVTISAQNAAYKELAFDAYEDYPVGDKNIKHGHYDWVTVDDLLDPAQMIYKHINVSISDEEKHTGNQSLKVVFEEPTATPPNAYFEFTAYKSGTAGGTGFWEFEPNKKYIIQYWQKTMPGANTTMPLHVEAGQGHTLNLESEIAVDDWVRKEYVLETANAADLRLYFIKRAHIGVFYLDDFRITPFNSASTAFVYDKNTYNVKAILDNNNFASIYQYDEQGNLVISKKETVEGVKSISSNRSNVQR